MRAQEAFKLWPDLEKELVVLLESLNANDVKAIYEQLKKLVSGFTPSLDIVDWVAVCNKNRNNTL